MFYQFWLNSADADVANFLRLFTFLDQQEIADLEVLMKEHPELERHIESWPKR